MIRIAHIVLAALLLALPAAAQPTPHIPLLTNFTYWDHHWLQWLPTHPRYEAIEAAVAEVGDRRLVRVWLTERAPPKRQVFFFDDEGVARAQGANGLFRPIRYGYDAAPERPAALALAFDDHEGRPISWTVRFDGGQRLSTEYSGLKPPGGHGEDVRFLLFWIGPNATTMDSVVAVGPEVFGVTAAELAARKHYYGAAYSRGAYNGVFLYESAPITRGYRAAPFGFAGAGRIELTERAGGLAVYRHFFAAHDMSIAFDPPLPRTASGYRGSYKISFDGRLEVLTGEVTGRDQGFTWRPAEPGWARPMIVKSEMHPQPDGYVLTLSR